MELEFVVVTGEDDQIQVLYDLLSKRSHKISHRDMPPYGEHHDFVRGNPYRSWHLIKTEGKYIGSFYITDQNTIGINILDDFTDNALPSVIAGIRSRFSPLPALKSVRNGAFSINVAPSNTKLIEALERAGCVLAQLSYVMK